MTTIDLLAVAVCWLTLALVAKCSLSCLASAKDISWRKTFDALLYGLNWLVALSTLFL